MRILLFKFCNNIRFLAPTSNRKETNGGNTEIDVVIQNLLKENHQITVLTNKSYIEFAPKEITVIPFEAFNLDTLKNYDLVLTFNSILNCFGGVVSNETLMSYRILNKAQEVGTHTIYAVTDTLLEIGDLSGWIRNAQKKEKYLELNPNEYEIDGSKILCLTQTHDLTLLPKIWKSKENQFKKYGYFPFEKTVFFRKRLELDINSNHNGRVIYFGNPRGGKRDKNFNKFYCHLNVPVDVYGNWNQEKWAAKQKHVSSMPIFHGKKDMYELHKDINGSICHCYISDPQNENTIWTTRLYEAILNRTLLFMDIKNDPQMKLFEDTYYYVKDSVELDNKIHDLLSNPELRSQKIERQFLIIMRKNHDLILNFSKVLDWSIKSLIG